MGRVGGWKPTCEGLRVTEFWGGGCRDCEEEEEEEGRQGLGSTMGKGVVGEVNDSYRLVSVEVSEGLRIDYVHLLFTVTLPAEGTDIHMSQTRMPEAQKGKEMHSVSHSWKRRNINPGAFKAHVAARSCEGINHLARWGRRDDNTGTTRMATLWGAHMYHSKGL